MVKKRCATNSNHIDIILSAHTKSNLARLESDHRGETRARAVIHDMVRARTGFIAAPVPRPLPHPSDFLLPSPQPHQQPLLRAERPHPEADSGQNCMAQGQGYNCSLVKD